MPPALRLDAVTATYGRTPALAGVSLAVEPGEFVALLGPSGCGKTTLLKLVGGYLAPSAGRVFLDGIDATALPPQARGVGMVFQNYALFPHLSARRNVSFGLEVRGVPRREWGERAAAMLARVGLTEAEFDRLPAALSGGQQQRVALARALILGPRVLLLDEPFANLDQTLRGGLRRELRTLQRETGVATLLVTHDPDEALALADRVGVLDGGKLLQIGPAAEVYRSPRTEVVARALGPGTVVPGDRVGVSGRVWVRPEAWIMGEGADACPHSWPATVAAVGFRGAAWLVELAAPWGPVSLPLPATQTPPTPGDSVRLGLPAGAFAALEPETP